MPSWDAFVEDKAYVIERFREGFFDYLAETEPGY